ncbi:hypothetical protein [Leptospira weilii]|uniref:Uncharacterized protein n=2 Tax=Leptospira weilii TaxID=28184 RepID=N1U0R7_9LEPT|nr:hypothetical protein [Leptospira weilii]EMN42724.1 hypothetical protein LEP1GSC086_1171 [Leptospira weilii str. LNT 1234]EMY14118.1 hypothetical protein LEP1GSC043_2800 [Leptospira weilii str. Ecochallenge]QDK23086.1 hypothetical protein FHG67_10430 [Leptospira weilii]QDK27274.1 hypothetical protein FHG68_11820 [Leptospira weilii]UPY77651.1 hypothetical protein FH581_001950 [Leptospira weilii]
MKFTSCIFAFFLILFYSNCKKPDHSQEMILQEKIDFMGDCNTILGILGNIREFRKKSSDSLLQETLKLNRIAKKQEELTEIWKGKRIFLRSAELVGRPRKISNLDKLNINISEFLIEEYTVTHPLSGLDGFYVISDKNDLSKKEFLQVRIFRLLKNSDPSVLEIHERTPLEGKIISVHYDGGQNRNPNLFESIYVILE